MEKVFHIAAQYLATTAISFLEAKSDDSHTNLAWQNGALSTHSLSESNCRLSLDYRSFSLIWTNDAGYRNEFSLDGKTHSEIITWIRRTSLEVKFNKVYEYKLHYELPYKDKLNAYIFQRPSKEVTEQLIQQRDLAQQALEKVLKDQDTAVRVWPHHFDSGAFFTTKNKIGIGLGMAVPDTMINDFYFYVSGYKGHDAIELPEPIQIENGNYHHKEWKGFVLPVAGTMLEEAVEFYTTAIRAYVTA